jgi:hypothetical protein
MSYSLFSTSNSIVVHMSYTRRYTILSTTRRLLMLVVATRRYMKLLDATRRYSTLLGATRRYTTLLEATRRYRRYSRLLDPSLLASTLSMLLDATQVLNTTLLDATATLQV